MKKKAMLAFLSAAVAILFWIRCTSPTAGTATETENVSAMLYNPHGSPAAHAKIKFYPRNYNPRTGGLGKTATSAVKIDSTTTDTKGNYIAKLDTGMYTILASGDSGVAYQDSIKVIKGDTAKPVPDTLKAPGSIKGIIQLQPGDDARTVFILFMGTHTFITPDDAIGNFIAPDLAEGKYRVRILTTLDNYAVMDTSLSAVAGRDSVLPSPIVLRFTGIPVPTGLRIAYDTSRQIVTITWARSDTSLVKGYNVFRKDIDSSFQQTPINGATLVKDTMYRDTTVIQDRTYEYKVVAIDKGDNAGNLSAGVSVVIASYFVVDSTYGTIGTGQGQFNYPWDITIASNGDIYIADEENKRVQVFDQFMNYKREFGNGILMPVNIALDSLGNAYVSGASATGNDNNSIFVFDPTGTIIDTVIIGKFANDFALGINDFFVVSDSVSAFSYDGTLKRTWWCSGIAYSITIENPNRIWVSSYLLEDKVRIFDTLGNIVDSLNIEPHPFSIAINKKNGRVFINCTNDAGDWLKVLDGSHKLLAIYKLPLLAGEPAYIALHPDGSVYEVLQNSGKILKLRFLLP